jgi:hypothetical protein
MMSRWVSFNALLAAALCVSPASAAPVFTCYPVVRGDTAARIALRLTKDANNAYAPWFQILDPAASAFISKSQYDRIHPGWQACIDHDQVLGPAPPIPKPPEVSGAGAYVLPGPILQWWWAPVLFLATWLGWIATHNYLERRRAALRALERFGTSFIREFERPLVQQPGRESPLRSRLRILPQRDWVEIWLAPNEGWHYPNLSDHRKNVEYDVERIVTLLGERRFVCGRLVARGPWVVIPFRLEAA